MSKIFGCLQLLVLQSLLSPAPHAAQTEADGHRQAILRYLEQVRNETGAPGISAAVGLDLPMAALTSYGPRRIPGAIGISEI